MSVDWPGLLKWSIANGDSDVLTSSEFKQMDPERQKWLEEALKSMSVDQIAIMKSCADTLQLADPTDATEAAEVAELKVEALEQLEALIEDLDNARDLHLVGGFAPVVASLRCAAPTVRAAAAQAIAVSVQVRCVVCRRLQR
jgi:hsp70-interacting protein